MPETAKVLPENRWAIVADDDRPMPGYTKQELAREGLDPKRYRYCRSCRRWWPRRGFKVHQASHQKFVVKIDMPPTPKLRKGEVAILHPAWQQFIDFLVDAAIKDLLRNPSRDVGDDPPVRRGKRKIKEPEAHGELITVDEAIKRFGMTREEIMAQFDEEMRRASDGMHRLRSGGSMLREATVNPEQR